jgi:hypothetical protein
MRGRLASRRAWVGEKSLLSIEPKSITLNSCSRAGENIDWFAQLIRNFIPMNSYFRVVGSKLLDFAPTIFPFSN